MNFRNISSWCIRNPVAPIVLFVGLMLAGLISFARMQVNNAPDIDFPAAIVSVSQPGAAPNEMEKQVTQRVESAVRGIRGVDEINSTISEGNSSTFVTFELGTPPDRAVNDVRNAISQIRSNLPEGILEPQVTRIDAEDEPIMVMSAETTDMTLEQLSWYIDNTVAKRLLGVPAVAVRGARGRGRRRRGRKSGGNEVFGGLVRRAPPGRTIDGRGRGSRGKVLHGNHGRRRVGVTEMSGPRPGSGPRGPRGSTPRRPAGSAPRRRRTA